MGLTSIPNEIFLLVCTYLPQSDCRAIRFVSRWCSLLVTPIVFSTIHVCLSNSGLDRLQSIHNSAHLNALVTGIVFDIRLFEPNLTIQDYADLLLRQTRLLLLRPELLPSNDVDCLRLIEYAKAPLPHNREEFFACQHAVLSLRLINNGHRSYVRWAKEQQQWLCNEKQTDEIARTLRGFQRIEYLAIEDSWLAQSIFRSKRTSDRSTACTKDYAIEPGWSGDRPISAHLISTMMAFKELNLSDVHLHLLLDTPFQMIDATEKLKASRQLRNIGRLSLDLGSHIRPETVESLSQFLIEVQTLVHLDIRLVHTEDYDDTAYWSLRKLLEPRFSGKSMLRQLQLSRAAIDDITLLNLFTIHPKLTAIELSDALVVATDDSGASSFDGLFLSQLETTPGSKGPSGSRQVSEKLRRKQFCKN